MSRTRARLVAAAGLALATLTLAGCATPPGPGVLRTGPIGITAHGVGQVSGTPDKATIELAVATRDPSAQAALAENTQRSVALRAQLTAKGVAEADVATSRLSVNPTFDNTGTITGYEVVNQVTVTIRDIAAAGEIIDAAAQAVGDAVRVQALRFAIDDDSALLAAARTAAVRQAQEQAEQLAAAAGVSLGAIRSITETSSGPQPPTPLDAGAVADRSVPVSPGTQQLSVRVEIVYEIG